MPDILNTGTKKSHINFGNTLQKGSLVTLVNVFPRMNNTFVTVFIHFC